MPIQEQELASEVNQTGIAIQEILADFSDEQFNMIPSYGGWTAGQVTEHLLLSAGVVEVISGHSAPTTDRQQDLHLPALAAIFLNFSIKLASPDFIIPSEGYHSKEELLSKIKLVWDKLGESARLLDLSVTCLDFEFPGVGLLTRLEWIWFYVWHTQRHLRQLKNICTAVTAITV